MRKDDVLKKSFNSLIGGGNRKWIGFVLALLMPFVALAIQWEFWHYIAPFVWFLFFPTVFISARLGRLAGGLFSTVLSTLIVIYFFIPPQLSWTVSNPDNLFSVGMFLVMGYLFSDIQERFWKANQRAEEALKETRLAHEKITKLYEKTRELDELKTQFFANVSHELRTPLTLILGPVQKTLQTPNLNPAIRHDLEVVDRNARFLHRHVNDLLDVSKLDSGHMELHYSQVDLAKMARVMASQFNLIADEQKISYSVDTPEHVTAQVDAEKCQRIVLNLISNAFKFTPERGVIRISLREETGCAVLQVSDSGPGIPADKRDAVFERFRQLAGNAARKYGGTGLGLSIVGEFVSLHHGQTKVEDPAEGGAMFTVTLPLSAPVGVTVDPEPAALNNETSSQLVDELFMARVRIEPADRPAAPDKPLILVVEDNPDMREFISDVLEGLYRVTTAENGQAGLEQAILLKPDLVLTDLMMPVMSGDQMAQAIRQVDELKDVPIVMLTALADEQLRVKMLQASVQEYITKPFTVGELRARLENLLSPRLQAAEKLQLSELQYRNLFENMLEGVAYCRMIYEDGQPVDWEYLSVNKNFEELTGLTGAAGKYVTEVIPNLRENDPRVFTAYARVIASGKPEKFETYVKSLEQWFSVSVYSPGNDHFVTVFDRITERKTAEERLHESETKLQSIISTSRDAIGVSSQGKHVFANPAYVSMFGYANEAELIGVPVLDLIAPESREIVFKNIQDHASGLPAPADYEVIAIRKDNTKFNMEVRLSTYALKGEQFTQVIMRDITARKQAEKQIEGQLKKLWSLHVIDSAIKSSLDLQTTLETVLEQVTDQLNVDAASVLLVDKSTLKLERSQTHGFEAVRSENLDLVTSQGYAERIFNERQPVQVFNLGEVLDALAPGQFVGEERFASYIGVPLTANDQVVGVLEIYHRTSLTPDAEWFEFLETLAGQTVIAIDNKQLFENLKRSNLDLAQAYDATIEGWSRAMDLRDKETEDHTLRVTQMTLQLARRMGVSEAEIVHVRRGALLHDLGKIGVPDHILLKPMSLDAAEWEVMRRHPVFAYEMLTPIDYLKPALDIPYCHHEKWDGSGYPRRIKGEEIPLAARIFAVVDVWDALTSDRPYRKAWPKEKALAHIRGEAGTHFDPDIVMKFLELEEL
jgi:PAS domain S-box-containing protein